MKRTHRQIVAILSERTEREWRKLQELYHETLCGEPESHLVGEQRARWAAWDAALEIVLG